MSRLDSIDDAKKLIAHAVRNIPNVERYTIHWGNATVTVYFDNIHTQTYNFKELFDLKGKLK